MSRLLSKQRTNITVDAGILAQARQLDINISAVSEAALAAAVKRQQASAWARDNADIIEERRRWIEKNGLPLSGYQVLKI